MAKKGTYPDATKLVTRVMRARGIDPAEPGAVPQLARETDFDRNDLYRWFNGQHQPRLDKALDLLGRAGVLDGIDDAHSPRAATPPDLAVLVLRLEKQVELLDALLLARGGEAQAATLAAGLAESEQEAAAQKEAERESRDIDRKRASQT